MAATLPIDFHAFTSTRYQVATEGDRLGEDEENEDDGDDDDDDDDDDDGESAIVITARQIAEVNGEVVLEDEDTDDALTCPMIRRYDAASHAFKVVVREAPFCQPRRPSECDVVVALEASAGEETEGKVRCGWFT